MKPLTAKEAELIERLNGRGKRLTINYLCTLLDVTPRMLRRLKEKINKRRGILVGSSHGDDNGKGGGYYLITTRAELDEAKAEYVEKAVDMMHKASELEQAWTDAMSEELAGVKQ